MARSLLGEGLVAEVLCLVGKIGPAPMVVGQKRPLEPGRAAAWVRGGPCCHSSRRGPSRLGGRGAVAANNRPTQRVTDEQQLHTPQEPAKEPNTNAKVNV